MDTVIYLSGRHVRAAVGRNMGDRMLVTSVCSADVPAGCIVDGQVMQEERFAEILMDFWKKQDLPKRNVTLVVVNAPAVTRTVLMPRLSPERRVRCLAREFASVERAKDPVYTCRILGEQRGVQRVLAAMVEREFLDQHIRRFRRLGIRIRAVSVGILAELELLDQLPYIGIGTCVVQMLDGRNLISILYVCGQYYHFTSTRISGEHGTPEFGIEAARALSSMRQFLQSQNREEAVTQIYLGGGFEDADLEICRESMLQMDQSLLVDQLHPDGCEKLVMAEGLMEDAFGLYFTEIAGLFVARDRLSLMYQYEHSPEWCRRRRKFLGWMMPAAAAGTVLAAIILVQALLWSCLCDRIGRQADRLGDPVSIGHVMEYDRLEKENELLRDQCTVVRDSLDAIHSYPIYTTQVRQTILSCADADMKVKLCSFDAVRGDVTVEVETEDSGKIHRFVDQLEGQTAVFDRICYEGFQYDDRTKVWQTTVRCCMRGEKEDETREVVP